MSDVSFLSSRRNKTTLRSHGTWLLGLLLLALVWGVPMWDRRYLAVSLKSPSIRTKLVNHSHDRQQQRFPDDRQPENRPRLISKTITNLSLVMMGDSLTRYQYLSLVNFLHTGQWNSTIEHRHRTSDLTDKNSFDNFTDFYQVSNRVMDGQETCDCFRVDSKNKQVYVKTARENRFYADPSAGNHVAYIQKLGSYAARGTLFPETIYTTTMEHNNNTWFNKGTNKFTWKYRTWKQTIRNFVAKMNPKPQFFVFNAGWWPNDLNKKSLTGIKEALQDAGITGIYKTVTWGVNGTRTPWLPPEDLACRMFPCFYLNWTADLPKSAYIDRAHFVQASYHQMNQELLLFLQRLNNDYLLDS